VGITVGSAAAPTPRPGEGDFDRPSRRSRKTRAALIDAARALLEDEGVAGLTVRAVTDRADVAHGTFYHHFASTEAVLAAGIEESMREFSAEMEVGFAQADDKSWVLVASLARTFRMLCAHPALPWMLERPQVLAQALRRACGPFAVRDVQAMIAAGDVAPSALENGMSFLEWALVGALVEVAQSPKQAPELERRLVALALRVLALPERRITSLLGRLGEVPAIRRTRPAHAQGGSNGRGA
jgi:AcrR family transcriptional regulator